MSEMRSPQSPNNNSNRRSIQLPSIKSFGSFVIPKRVFRTKERALKVSVVLFLLEILFTTSSTWGVWLIINLSRHQSVQTFTMVSTLSQQSNNPADNGKIVTVKVVPEAYQACVYTSIAISSIGFILSLSAAYSTKIPVRFLKYIFFILICCAVSIIFLGIAAQAGFETNLNQMTNVVALSGTLDGIDFSGRGFGYATLIMSWVVAIPLTIIANGILYGHLKGVWENQWRETLRASFGAGIPDWLNGTLKKIQSVQTLDSSPIKSPRMDSATEELYRPSVTSLDHSMSPTKKNSGAHAKSPSFTLSKKSAQNVLSLDGDYQSSPMIKSKKSAPSGSLHEISVQAKSVAI